ncbi:hypothetical protein ABT065_18300 [Streptomyces sp. NPDC002764]|jgi:hypothetical protein|uniref:hypothetical protein n=1 Tax=Streptomyces sp. NPDC002764 TaxID=3154428 RepID=UPI00331A575A
MPAPRLLGVYLNDHLAGATVGAELGHRMVQEHGDTAYGSELRSLATEIAQDRRALLRIMGELDVPARRYKIYGAWLGEKLGRAKPNGRLLRRSGLTLLIELEALRSGVAGKALLWRALLTVAAADPRFDHDRLEELRQRAERQMRTLDSLHTRAATGLLATPEPQPSESSAARSG